ncbi:MAG: hypothetical protein C4530_01070 [Desulfobacteraceae bacterium]|nr:MAG: hypothetical protein C4530_01070 [Desulfobacteraceae bacterium]
MNMRKHLSVLIACLVTGWLAATAFAADSHNTHNPQKATEHNTQESMDHGDQIGKKIHESDLKGYRIAYRLLDLPGREAKHLVTYIVDSGGKPVNDAKVGYLVVDPAGKEQKVMAMAMKDSFGGDVDLSSKGKYTIKSKAVVGDKNLMDSFTFDVN